MCLTAGSKRAAWRFSNAKKISGLGPALQNGCSVRLSQFLFRQFLSFVHRSSVVEAFALSDASRARRILSKVVIRLRFTTVFHVFGARLGVIRVLGFFPGARGELFLFFEASRNTWDHQWQYAPDRSATEPHPKRYHLHVHIDHGAQRP